VAGDVAKSIKQFKAGMKQGDDEAATTTQQSGAADTKALRSDETASVHKDKSATG
jgi:hypothetical protein